MAYRNYINIPDELLETKIYRIMPVQRLLECFQKKQLVLVPPKKWDDPFENLLLSSKVQTQSNEIGDLQKIRDSVYGQCWTMHRETDAMWRIYSYEKNGAKVQTTIKKLLEALNKCHPKSSNITCFIGRVQYLPQKHLVDTLKSLDLFDPNGSGIAESLMYKRLEFKHEKEIRIVYTGDSKEVHPFDIDPNELFTEVVFDPRMDPELFLAYKEAVKAKGFKEKITQSTLYQPPSGLTISV